MFIGTTPTTGETLPQDHPGYKTTSEKTPLYSIIGVVLTANLYCTRDTSYLIMAIFQYLPYINIK